MVGSERELTLPRHLVLIPDGNGRWAQKHRVPIAEGHLRGGQAIKTILYELENLDINYVTVWGFSTENWSRTEEEVTGIMTVMESLIDTEGERLVSKGYKFRHVGRRDRIQSQLLAKIEDLEQKTSANTGKTLVLALDYGGRDEIVRAVHKSVGQQIDEENFKNLLDTAGLPDPDLIIRTSGETRTSGVYPYQGVYAEFVSSPVLLPDFDKTELFKCLEEYSKRQRRFGRRPEIALRGAFDWLGVAESTFEAYVEAILPVLDRTTEELIAKWEEGRYYRSSQALLEDVEIYRGLLSGGKKLRPALVMLGYENFLGEDEFRQGALRAAISYEIIHNSFLVHDDIEDDSTLRRGQPSIHEQYRIRHETQGGLIDPKQYGRAVAINTGSLGPFRALDIVWGIDNRQDRINKAQRWLRYVIETTLGGQRRDLADIPLNQLAEHYVYQIYHQKTAVYTIVGPLSLGGILAGASDKDLAHINTFGVNLGMAFQMVDDHLGLYGDEQILGKPVDSDIKEAKKTLHFVRAFQAANPTERAFLQNVWGKKDVTKEELEQVRELIIRMGVRDAVLDKADVLAQKAKRVIPKITNDPTISAILGGLADFVVARNF